MAVIWVNVYFFMIGREEMNCVCVSWSLRFNVQIKTVFSSCPAFFCCLNRNTNMYSFNRSTWFSTMVNGVAIFSFIFFYLYWPYGMNVCNWSFIRIKIKNEMTNIDAMFVVFYTTAYVARSVEEKCLEWSTKTCENGLCDELSKCSTKNS